MLADALRAGLLAAGCRVLDAGVLSTPGIAVLVRHAGADGGAVITASHNPTPWNGIKLQSAKGLGLGADAGRAVRDRFDSGDVAERGADGVGRAETIPNAVDVHVDRVLATVDADRIRGAGLTVALDSVNGAGGAEMQALLERLGCRVVGINLEPTGRFGRPPEPVPEHLGDLAALVKREGAALGLAQDPDADRLSLVDETGRPIGEEYTLALACRHRLSQEPGPIAANLSTSRLVDDVAREAGVRAVRSPVGEVNVAETIEAEGCIIGGEGNGGVIDPRVTLVRDSLAGAALVLEMMAARGRTLSELVAELPVYHMVKDKVALGSVEPAAIFEAALGRFPDAETDRRDGLHLSWPDGWLHVRASNTEPIVRVIAEAAEESVARDRAAAVKALAAAG
jgi:phosphomannomutase